MKNKNEIKEACIYNNIESAISLALSFVISTFVIATFAVYVVSNDNFKTEYPDGLDLSSAADALTATFGNSAKYIWAFGLLAAGQSSTMTGTYAG
jgi:natural resistance-associated macrophage protein